MHSAEKSDYASSAQSLCGIAIILKFYFRSRIKKSRKSPKSKIERNPNALSPQPRAMAYVKNGSGIVVKKGDGLCKECVRNRIKLKKIIAKGEGNMYNLDR